MANLNTIAPDMISETPVQGKYNPATGNKWTKAQVVAAQAAAEAAGNDGKAKDVVENNKQFGNEICSVALKMPNGMQLTITQMVDGQEPVMGGGFRVVKVAQQLGEPVYLNGYATPAGKAPNCLVVGGYAITPNVSKAFMERWLEQHADSDLVKNNLIFIRSTSDRARDEADEKSGIRNGMEALDPEKLPMAGVQTTDEQKKRMASSQAA